MRTVVEKPAVEARQRLIELGGRTAQDLGLGRIPGQLLVYLYFQEQECSLDQICEEQGLSKAAVSTATRQLETLGLVRQVWRRGDRRNYYRTADNVGAALQQGLLTLVRRKLDAAKLEMEQVWSVVEEESRSTRGDRDLEFLKQRLQRARTLRDRVARVLGSRLLDALVR
jgi:DNA-binding transcriptional regulator GbsR (MarR family)